MRLFLALVLFVPAALAGPFSTSLSQGSGQISPLDFRERFALSEDRGALLGELIEGTEDYFFYSCLHAQVQGRHGDVGRLLKEWGRLEGKGARYWELSNRHALFTFDSDRETSLAYLRKALGLQFNHQRQAPGAELGLPSRLDETLLSNGTLTSRALQFNQNSLRGFRDTALFGLAGTQLSKSRLGELLDRLERPSVPNLAALVIRDLELQKKDDLGSRRIHGRLTLAQLEECVRLRPSLLQASGCVALFLQRLGPNADVDWRADTEAREAYLDTLERFTGRLSSAFNSLKAHVLHHRLQHDLEVGQLNRKRLIAYLRLPRRAPYTSPEQVRQARGQERVVPTQSFGTGLAPIGDDEALVRACLAHFLVGDASTAAFDGLLREEYLGRLFAETKLLAGVGERARWYELLDSKGAFELLEQRVELDFAPTQQRSFGATDAVSLSVDVKNVPRLLVKVFEIDTFNYYRAFEREVDASIELEGLVPNLERALEFNTPSIQRVRRTIELPSLKEAGVYVVELVGAGISSRAVIRKGELRFVERLTSAGHAFRVLDEDGYALKGARIWFGGKEHLQGETGEIYLPYSTQPASQTFVLLHGEQADLGLFSHRAEQYRLKADVYVDREALLSGELAQILVRPALSINGHPAALTLLEDAVLTIRSRGLDGVEATLEVRDLELSAAGEYVAEIRVPRNLRSLQVDLRGRVRNLTRAEDVDLHSSAHTFPLNRIDATASTDTPLLTRSAAGYALDVLGKDGEPRVGRAVNLRFELEDYTDEQNAILQTDERGRIELGQLVGVRALYADGFAGSVAPWQLKSDRRSYPWQINGVFGEDLEIPYVGPAQELSRQDVSLFEVRGGVIVRDVFERVALEDGFIKLVGLAAGDYELHLVREQVTLHVRITRGQRRNGWAIGGSRWLALEGRNSLHISSAEILGDELVIRLVNAGAEARVHVIAARYLPAFDLETGLRGPGGLFTAPYPKSGRESDYQSGRALSDEVRYVLDRRFTPRFPGNMLRRPGILLNPWSVEDTTTAIGIGGGGGGGFGGGHRGPGDTVPPGSTAAVRTPSPDPGGFPNLDFLSRTATVLTNLHPGKDGLIRIPLADLGDGQQIRILALDRDDRVLRNVLRTEVQLKPNRHALEDALVVDASVAERRRIEFLGAGQTASFEELPGSQVELIDDLASVFQLFQALSGTGELNEFAFLLEWPELDQEAKQALYSEFTCHELDLFLLKKDPTFFQKIARPHLANKVDRDFMDDWFLGESLEAYVSPWAFARLNILERILLAQRLSDETIRDHVLDLAALRPEDPAQRRRQFDRLMGAGGLDAAAGEVISSSRKRNKNANERGGPMSGGDAGRVDFGRGLPATESNGFFLGKGQESQDAAEIQSLEAAKDDMLGLELRALGYAGGDDEQRHFSAALFRAMDPTRRLLETYYHGRTIQEELYALIPVNGFWRDYAEHRQGPFVSPHLADAVGSKTEMLLALALLDLPFAAPEHVISKAGNRTDLQAGGPLLVVRRELSSVARRDDAPPILVSQNYYRLSEPKRREGNRMVDAFVTEEFVVGVAYGCRVVVTNPTSTARELELLLQVPRGALAIQNGFETRGVGLALGAYGTQTLDYAFYFPRPGSAAHYPVQVTEEERIIAAAEGRSLPIVAQATVVDETSWEYVSQNGTLPDVLAYLDASQPQSVDLSRIAWRMGERADFEGVLANLRARHVYNDALWSYAFLHADARAMGESLKHAQGFLSNCGPVLVSSLLSIDPIERRTYQRTEFDPLVLARAHEFAGVRDVQNASVLEQYRRLLDGLTYGGFQGPEDRMELAYFLLLQNRIQEALDVFGGIKADSVEARIQYDYMRCYMAFFGDSPLEVRDLAAGYSDYPVAHWRARFADVVSQLDEVEGALAGVTDPDDRGQNQVSLASSQPALDLKVEAGRVKLSFANMDGCELRFYPMDVELLFSSHPFGAQALDAFGYVRPTEVQAVSFDDGETGELEMGLPADFIGANVVVEARGHGIVRRQASYASSLSLRMMENYGQLQVRDAASGAPLSRVYVKVFARMADGTERFHKDGYTDLRGRFDYASLSGNDLGGLQRFAILVLDDERGAEVREATPPQQ